MQRITGNRIVCQRLSSINRWPRWSSVQAARKELTADRDEAVVVPKLPAFDYTPPPYDGPSGEEILAKRKEFLNPSMFFFYKKPVSFSHLIPMSLISPFFLGVVS